MLDAIISRGKEPSTYAGLGILFSLLHVSNDLATAIVTTATAVFGLVAVIRSERKA